MTIKKITKMLLVTVASLSGTAAFAADLDKLSDNDLLNRIERLETIIGPGDKYAVRSGGNKVRLTINGQASVAVVGFHDGDDTGVVVGTNSSSGSRFRILGDVKINDKWSAGTKLEFQLDDDDATFSDNFNQNNRSLGGSTVNGFGTRLANIFFKHKDYGTVRFGQINTASNGTSQADLSGTGLALSSGFSDYGGGLLLRNDSTGELIDLGNDSPTLNDFFDDLDGLSRDDAIRYDTPTIKGFSLGTTYQAAGGGAGFDVALRYKNKDLNGFGVSAAAAYSDNEISDDDERLTGSLSVIHLNTGINATIAGGEDNEDGRFIYGKLGIVTEFNSLGKTAFSGDAIYTEDLGNADSEAFGFGLAVVQKIDATAAEVFLGYRNYNVNNIDVGGPSLVDAEQVNVIFTGSRIKF